MNSSLSLPPQTTLDTPSEFDLSPNKQVDFSNSIKSKRFPRKVKLLFPFQHGYRMVVMEMSLAICGIVLNLVVLISIRLEAHIIYLKM